jgi:phosphotriesterase-related protein
MRRRLDSGSNRMTRRQTLLLMSRAIAGAALPALEVSAGEARRPQAFAPGAIVRTLLKDVRPESLASGPVLFHEHLSMKYPPDEKEHFTDDVDLMVAEVRAAGKEGIACIVDGGHADMARRLDALKRIATESGVAIVASGGYYMQRTYPPNIAKESADQIAEELANEALAQRFGAFGEIGQQGGVLTADETKVFEAVAKAQVRTHLPIFTHNAYTGTRQVETPVPMDAALRQLDVLEAAGAKPAHIAIGHVCCLDDPKAAVARRIAERGAFVGFDRVTIQSIISDEKRVKMVMELVEAGHADRLLIASDFAVGRSLKQRGGPGIAQAWTVFGPMLRKAGLPEATLRSIMIDNPRRFLAFVPA